MSNGKVVSDTSLTLRSLLDERLNQGDAADRLGSAVTVTVDSPHRVSQEEFRLNLFLYNVMQDEGRRNSGGWVPLARTDRTQKFAPEPLALRLYYLLTAFAANGQTEHHLLGEAMQALYLHRRLAEGLLLGSLKDGPVRAEHVEVNLLNLDVDALQKIWGSQTEFLRTSVAYEVTPVFLDDDRPGAEEGLVGVKKDGTPQDDYRIVDVVPFPYPLGVAPDAAPPGAVVRLYGSGLLMLHPETGKNLLRVLFGGVEAEQILAGSSEGAVNVRVPPGLKPGTVEVRLRLDRYLSRSVPFEIAEPP
jgi:Pvc16 N-terminal domain